MLMIALLLAVSTFFIPKKIKNVFGYISVGIIVLDIIGFLFLLFSKKIELFHQIMNFGKGELGFVLISDPFSLIFRSIRIRSLATYVFINILKYLIYLGIAFAGMNVSLIKYKSDEEDTSLTIANDEVISASDGKKLRVIEVNAGLCTGTLRGSAIEARINQIASQNWKFEEFETIKGRCCLIFARYKMIICFSKNN
ncbi:MAG: hypothetical protein K6C97_12420 [Treponema sp.]|nr:hypothetical protein [Treponema sp.]